VQRRGWHAGSTRGALEEARPPPAACPPLPRAAARCASQRAQQRLREVGSLRGHSARLAPVVQKRSGSRRSRPRMPAFRTVFPARYSASAWNATPGEMVLYCSHGRFCLEPSGCAVKSHSSQTPLASRASRPVTPGGHCIGIPFLGRSSSRAARPRSGSPRRPTLSAGTAALWQYSVACPQPPVRSDSVSPDAGQNRCPCLH